ncbi:hypothetical protein ES705_22899 [subsurface metagenome]
MKAQIIIFLFFFVFSVYGIDSDKKINVSLLSLTLAPGIEYPIETGKNLLNLGGVVDLNGRMPLPFLPFLSVNAGLSYGYIPVRAETSLSLIALGLGGGLTFEIAPRFFIFGSALCGGYYGLFNETLRDEEGVPYESQQGGNLFFSGGAGISFYLTPYLSIGVNASYVNYLGFFHGIRGSLGTCFHLSGFQRKIRIQNIELDNIFPVFFKYYDNHTVGSAVLSNNERFPVKNIEISLFVNQYMDSPKICIAPTELKPGQEKKIELNALFLDEVLEITEGTKVAAGITVDYTLNGRKRKYVTVETLRLHNRNAMIWDDDRKAAAFVNAKDPEVLKFSKMVAGLVRNKGPKLINQNLRMGMGLFEALSTYGLNYVIDPNTPAYEEASKDKSVIDFLQFPRQTLEYKGGDCDDLSILYCALLESIGIETAFITIPGHIFIAFSLDMDPGEARKTFSSEDDLVFRDDKTWVPVEITRVGDRFLEAWRVGSKQWRDNVEKDAVGFYPMNRNWQLYEAAGSPGEKVELDLSSLGSAADIYEKEINEFVERELFPRVEKLQTAIKRSNNPVKLMNRLGVLYARFGLTEKAESLFQDILDREDYIPALINMGNIYYLKNDMIKALDFFERVQKKDPDNTIVLLNLARINYELKQYALVNKYSTRFSI